jgi:hypothetical protein
VTSPIKINSGGASGAPVTITGVDSFGNPMDVQIIGTRAPVYSPDAAAGSEVFRLLSGADHLQFQHMDFTDGGERSVPCWR